MTIEEKLKKVAENTQRLLKVRYVQYPIAMTEKGPLTMKFIKDVDDYEIILDSVPLDMKEYDNRELRAMLEKYLYGTDAD